MWPGLPIRNRFILYPERLYNIYIQFRNSQMFLGFQIRWGKQYCCGHNLPPKFHVGWTPPSPLSPLSPPKNNISDIPCKCTSKDYLQQFSKLPLWGPIGIGIESENVFFFSFWSLSESPIRRMGFESPLNPSYYPSNGASDLPTYFCQRSLRATPKVKHESPQTIIWKKKSKAKIIIILHSEHSSCNVKIPGTFL